MRKARVYVCDLEAGLLEELEKGRYLVAYKEGYHGLPISLTMPINDQPYIFDHFPPFFEGLLPEGIMLEALLRKAKLDKSDLFGQLMQVGQDMVGAVTVEEIK